ncbi:TetR/AcrR family transcriptional regulator [Actinomycetospora chiangmaiensis]|uniref:TetR/AcrR family transcriptional regulator n=1 Tax=Actinomycetospora chiangmaiensis TaxID=402650 RepID=UPI00035D36D8|nr:TetR/AcrR family transcriptional regulator [Actinomycetospora chiangmaiensis]
MASPDLDPRVERTRAHVLDHARAMLAAGGPSSMTYSALAKQARVTRQTLYRHWPTLEALYVDLVLDRAVREIQSLAGAAGEATTAERLLGAFLHQVGAGMDDPANAGPLMALVAQADHDPASRRALADVVVGIRDELNRLLEPVGVRITSGEYHQLAGPLFFRRFFAREPVTADFVDEVVATWSRHRSAS